MRELLTGWGRTSPTAAVVHRAAEDDEAVKAAGAAGGRGVIARGLGRSYNDAAQNAGGDVVDLAASRRFHAFDPSTGVARVAAGVSILDLLETCTPQGWFPPVTPGTQHVTVGGAIAADVHGKNHHIDGSFSEYVESLRIWTPARGVVDVSRETDADVFWATCGGMGLTGVVLDATIRMRPVESSRISVDIDRAGDLDEVMALLADPSDDQSTYSVAWIDCQARGRSMGRSVLTRGRHATAEEVGAAAPLAVPAARSIPTPPWVPPHLVNRLTVRAFNELWFRKAPRRARGVVQPYFWFFYPLDLIRDWNRMYGRAGFVQYQFVVPFGADGEAALRASIERLSSSHTASFLAVLKRFGPGSSGHLSFPQPGWTLALDFPVGPRHLPGLLDELDRVVTDAGGRCYLAKDGRSPAAMIPRWYPRLEEWREVQRSLDPAGVLQSDLSRRLDLLGRGMVV